MDEAAYQQWWQIHVRVARGVLLSPEERTRYDAGRQKWEKDEQLCEVHNTREVREQLCALERERAQLEQRRQQLLDEIAALEQLPRPT